MADSTEYAIQYIYKILDEYTPALKKIQEQTEKMGKESEHATKKAHEGFKLFGIAVGSILTAEGIVELGKKAFEFGKDCVQAAEKSSASIALLKNNLINLKKQGGPSFDELEEKAKKLSKNSIFSGEQILLGSTQALMRFGNIQGPMFDKAQQAAMNLSVAMHGVNATEEDLASASQLVGRAMETGNLRVFQKYGVNLTDMEKKQVQYLHKIGATAEVQSFVLNKLATASGINGAMNAMTMTAAGMQKQISNQFEEMKVKVGNALLPIVYQIMQMAVKAMPMLENAVSIITPLLTGLVEVAKILIGVFTATYEVINKNKLAFAVLGAGIAAFTIITKLAAIQTMFWSTVTKIQTAVQMILNIVMAVNPIALIVLGIAALIFGIIMLVTHIKEVTKFLQDLGQAIKTHVLSALHSLFKLLDNPIIRTIGLLLFPLITIPLLIAKNFKMVKQVISEVIGLFTGKSDIFKTLGDMGKTLGNMFGGQHNEIIPTNNTPSVNVNTSNTLTVYKEKGLGVVPYKKSGNLGKQAI